MIRYAPEVACGEVGGVVKGAHTGGGDVAYAVVVRGVVALRTVSPAPVVAEVAGGEAHAEIFEEICRPASTSGGQCGFGHHGVALEESRPAVDGGKRA